MPGDGAKKTNIGRRGLNSFDWAVIIKKWYYVLKEPIKMAKFAM